MLGRGSDPMGDLAGLAARIREGRRCDRCAGRVLSAVQLAVLPTHEVEALVVEAELALAAAERLRPGDAVPPAVLCRCGSPDVLSEAIAALRGAVP